MRSADGIAARISRLLPALTTGRRRLSARGSVAKALVELLRLGDELLSLLGRERGVHFGDRLGHRFLDLLDAGAVLGLERLDLARVELVLLEHLGDLLELRFVIRAGVFERGEELVA